MRDILKVFDYEPVFMDADWFLCATAYLMIAAVIILLPAYCRVKKEETDGKENRRRRK